jgi:predicted SAM-dependent methyltransferase/ADP-heptose:LPS heptosyltransferase
MDKDKGIRMTWKATDPQGNEAAKISWEIVKYTRGLGLDVGAGLTRTFPHFITVDNNIDVQLFHHPMPRPDMPVTDGGKLEMFSNESMDFVFSSHMLEHVEEERLVKVIKEWWRVTKLEGYLVLYLPDADEYPKVGEAGANPDHKWNVTFNAVMKILHNARQPFDLIDFQKRNENQEYSLFFVFQKKAEQPKHWHHDRPRTIGKTCGLVRYGAIGDSMQASSVIAALKAEGYTLTLYCAEGPGYEALKHDPHVDEFYIQGRGQVPDAALGAFWEYHRKKYDHWVNLSESVEGGLLTMANRITDTYSPAARHQLLDVNYVERQHLIAGVSHHAAAVKFYATQPELKWAKAEKKALGDFVVVWALAGSSVHKTWPWLDNAVSGILLDFPEVEVVLLGAEDGTVLEQGWQDVPRVHRRSGKWSVRESLAFAQIADVVIGGETGVLNAVAQEEMPKVVFLSHSTIENLTRDWVDTHSLASLGTVCKGRGNDEAPACHRLHFGWERCTEAPALPGTEDMYTRKGSGVAQCQYDIGAQDAYKVIWHVIQWRLEKYASRDGKPLPGVMTAAELERTRLTLPKHCQGPAQVLEDEAANERSVIEA